MSESKGDGDMTSREGKRPSKKENCVICGRSSTELHRHITEVHPLALGVEKDGISCEEISSVTMMWELLKEAEALGVPVSNHFSSIKHFLVWDVENLRMSYHIVTAGSMKTSSSSKGGHNQPKIPTSENKVRGHIIGDYLLRHDLTARKEGLSDLNLCLMDETLNGGSYSSLEKAIVQISKRWSQLHIISIVVYAKGISPDISQVPTHIIKIVRMRRKNSFDRVIPVIFKNEPSVKHFTAHVASLNDVLLLTGIRPFKPDPNLIDCMWTAKEDWTRYSNKGRHPPLHCRLCKISFGTVEQMGNHYEDVHPELKFKCPVCKRGMDSEADVELHLKLHLDSQVKAARDGLFTPLIPVPPKQAKNSSIQETLEKENQNLRKEMQVLHDKNLRLQEENQTLRKENASLRAKLDDRPPGVLFEM